MSCRQEDYQISKRLHCHYNKTKTPFYRLAPFKVEELSFNPYLVIYYDVLQDYQISNIKMVSRSKLKRAKIIENNIGYVSKHRTTHVAWWEHESFQPIVNMVSDITGLNSKGFESISVNNYGIGGHYSMHYDYFDEKLEGGTRMGSALFYLSDVDYGGSTVFPKLHLNVQPRKGSMLFWHNLHNNGNPNKLSLHGACPVIFGSKWIMTIWIREEAQFLNAPCYNA